MTNLLRIRSHTQVSGESFSQNFGLRVALAALAAAASLTAIPAFAITADELAAKNPDFYTLSSVDVVESPDSEAPDSAGLEAKPVSPLERGLNPERNGAKGLGVGGAAKSAGAGTGASQIVNVGLQIWKFVQDNAPVVTVEPASGNALPSGTQWNDLSGWDEPRSRGYTVVYKNLYGMNVVDFGYRVSYTTGGNYRGRGQYIANVSTVVDHLTVLWGWKFDASTQIPTVTNVGSVASPVAEARVLVNWTVKSPLVQHSVTREYTVTGKGSFNDLSEAPLQPGRP